MGGRKRLTTLVGLMVSCCCGEHHLVGGAVRSECFGGGSGGDGSEERSVVGTYKFKCLNEVINKKRVPGTPKKAKNLVPLVRYCSFPTFLKRINEEQILKFILVLSGVGI